VRLAIVGCGSGTTWGSKKEAGFGWIGGGRARGAPAVPTDKVGVGRRHRGWKWRFDSGGVRNGGGTFSRCEREERVRKVGEGLTYTVGASEGKENIEAAIVVGGGREVVAAGAMLGPRFSGLGGIEGNDKLAGGCEWGGRQSKRGHDAGHARPK
jgi:hypothetical protein